MEKTDIQIDRRKFLKIVGLTTTTVTAGIYGCKLENRAGNEKNSQGVIPVDKIREIPIGFPCWDMVVCVGRLFLHRMEKGI